MTKPALLAYRPESIRAHAPAVAVHCRSGAEFANVLCSHPDVQRLLPACEPGIDWTFPDGEVCSRLLHDVTGMTVYVVQSLANPTVEASVNDNLLALLTAVRACRDWGAARVVALLPALSYTRQDRFHFGRREPVTARLVAELMATSGLNGVVTYHAPEGPFRECLEPLELTSISPFALMTQVGRQLTKSLDRREMAVVAPDGGSASLAKRIARELEVGVAIGTKRRADASRVTIDAIEGLTAGRRVAFVVDDLLASGSTLLETLRQIRRQQPTSRLVAAVSHISPVSETFNVLKTMHQECALEALHVTNTIPMDSRFASLPFIHRHDVSATFVDCLTSGTNLV